MIQVNDSAEPAATDDEYPALVSEFMQIHPHVMERLPFTHRVRWLFRECCPIDRDKLPDVQGMRASLDGFYAMSEDERRRVLNGWDVDPRFLRLNKQEAIDEITAEGVIRTMLHVRADRSGCRAGETRGYVARVFDGTASPVSVMIAVGAQKMQAVRALRDLAGQIEREWERLVSRPDGNCQKDSRNVNT